MNTLFRRNNKSLPHERIKRLFFFQERGTKLDTLEWKAISSKEATPVLTIKGNGETELHKDYRDAVTGSGRYCCITFL